MYTEKLKIPIPRFQNWFEISKPNLKSLCKVFKSCGQLSKSCQKLQNSDFQSQKLSKSF